MHRALLQRLSRSFMSSPRLTKPQTNFKSDKEPPAVPSLSSSVVLIAPLKERTADGYDYVGPRIRTSVIRLIPIALS